jgi:ABC-type sugar transport system permease subunit
MVFAMTSGGPGTATTVLSYLLYNIGWTQFDFGGAAALSLLIAAVNLTLIMATLRITRVQQRSI